MRKSIIPAIILATGIGYISIDRGRISSYKKNLGGYVENTLNRFFYDKFDGDQRYILQEHEFNSGTLDNLTGGRQHLNELIRDINGLEYGNLKPGDSILVPVPSEKGKTFAELYKDFNAGLIGTQNKAGDSPYAAGAGASPQPLPAGGNF
jgi:hypothetical protein